MTSQGHPRAEFQRALECGNLLQAKALAKIVGANAGKLSLTDAISLLMLMAAKSDASYEKAAVRWAARFLNEVPAVTLEDAQLALAALAGLERHHWEGAARDALVSLCRQHGLLVPGRHGQLRR